MNTENLSTAQHFSRVAAGRFRARCWWVSFEDLYQTGLLAAVESQRTYDPNVGIDQRRYMWRAVLIAVQNEVWMSSAVATGGVKHNHTKARAEAAGMTWQHRVDADGSSDENDATLSVKATKRQLVDDAMPVDDAVYTNDWTARVRSRLIVAAHGDEVVVSELLDDADAGKLRSVGAAGILRMRATADMELLQLLQEKRGN